MTEVPAKKGTRPITWVILVVFMLFFLACIGLLPPPLFAAGYMLIGWILYLVRVLPQVELSVGGVVTAILCIAGVLLLGHYVGRSFVAGWKVRWTAAGTAIVVLLFVAGTAAVGITHQSVWIWKSDKPIAYYGFRSRETANRIKCQSNMREIWIALRTYAQAHNGMYPDSLAEIATTDEWINYQLLCPTRIADVDIEREKLTAVDVSRMVALGETHYVYRGRGLSERSPADTPILTEPLIDHGDGINVCFVDGRTEFVPAAEVGNILNPVRPPRPPMTPLPVR